LDLISVGQHSLANKTVVEFEKKFVGGVVVAPVGVVIVWH
jgi:hypothetical protein